MLVQVKDLKPNPFRRMNKYPIDQAKVEALKNSINETEFWDNILARKNSGNYEIAYGHHRLQALKELGIAGRVRLTFVSALQYVAFYLWQKGGNNE